MATASKQEKTEVFARSKLFDDLQPHERSANSLPLPPSKRSSTHNAAIPAISPELDTEPSSEFVSKDSGVFFVSQDSLVLPVLESSQTLDMSCLEDELEPESVAIFASKLPSSSASTPRFELPKASKSKVEVFASKIGSASTKKGILPKPIRERELTHSAHSSHLTSNPSLAAIAQSDLHPEDSGALGPSASSLSRALHFARSRLIELCDNYVFGVEMPLDGRLDILSELRSHFDYVAQNHALRIVSLPAHAQQLACKLCLYLLNQLDDERVPIIFYVDLLPSSAVRGYNIFERLIFSRLGLGSTATAEEKRAFLLSVGNSLFDSSVRPWAMDVLFAAYQTSLNTSQSAFLQALNEDQALYQHYTRQVFEYLIKRDASRAPVIILLQDDCTRWQGREDLPEFFNRQSNHSTLILCLEPAFSISGVETKSLPIPPLSESVLFDIAKQFFSDLKPCPDTFLQSVVARAQGNVTHLARVTRQLVLQDAIKIENFRWKLLQANAIEQIPATVEEFYPYSLAAYTKEQRAILNTASIMGPSFSKTALIQVMSLEEIPDEIPWFHKLREKWLESHIKALTDAEILRYHRLGPQDEQILSFSSISEQRFIASQLPAPLARSLRGSYASLLQAQSPNEDTLVPLYQSAGMAEQAVKAIHGRARLLSEAYFNLSLKACLEHALGSFGPELGESHIQLLLLKSQLDARRGRYEDAAHSYGAALRCSEFYQLNTYGVPAFIGMGHALRMQGLYTQARDTLLFALDFAQHLQEPGLLADCNDELARITLAQGAKGALVNALRYADKALESRRAIGDIGKTAQTLDIIAEVCLIRGDFERAKQAATEAYHSKNAKYLWHETPQSLILLALIDAEEQQTKSLDLLPQALHIVERSGHVEDLFKCLGAMVNIHTLKKNYDLVRACLGQMNAITQQVPIAPWKATRLWLQANFDFARGSFQKTTSSLKGLFEVANPLKNQFVLCNAYQLSAFLNFEVLRRKLGSVSVPRAERLFTSSIALYEAIGAWPELAKTQRVYAEFLSFLERSDEAEFMLTRAQRIDPR